MPPLGILLYKPINSAFKNLYDSSKFVAVVYFLTVHSYLFKIIFSLTVG